MGIHSAAYIPVVEGKKDQKAEEFVLEEWIMKEHKKSQSVQFIAFALCAGDFFNKDFFLLTLVQSSKSL